MLLLYILGSCPIYTGGDIEYCPHDITFTPALQKYKWQLIIPGNHIFTWLFQLFPSAA